MDIYRQLTLFLDDTDHGLNLEPVSLEAYFGAAQRWMEYRVDYENYLDEYREWQRSPNGSAPPLPPSRPTVPRAEIEQALSPVFIRRRRRDIRDLYGDTALVSGQPVRFPEPQLDNLAYRLDKVYAKAGSYEDLIKELKKHRAARYRATEYLTDDAKKKPEYRDLFRAQDRIARLMAVLLLKRLESSIEAFRSTLNSLIQSNRNFREALDLGFVPIGPHGNTAAVRTVLRRRRPAGCAAAGGAASPGARWPESEIGPLHQRLQNRRLDRRPGPMITSASAAS